MPWINGEFIRENPDFQGPTVWQQDQQATIKIIASRHDFHDEDIAQGISACLNINGENSLLGDLDMGGFKIINMEQGAVPGEAAAWEQIITSASFDNTTRNLTLVRDINNMVVNIPDAGGGVSGGFDFGPACGRWKVRFNVNAFNTNQVSMQDPDFASTDVIRISNTGQSRNGVDDGFDATAFNSLWKIGDTLTLTDLIDQRNYMEYLVVNVREPTVGVGQILDVLPVASTVISWANDTNIVLGYRSGSNATGLNACGTVGNAIVTTPDSELRWQINGAVVTVWGNFDWSSSANSDTDIIFSGLPLPVAGYGYQAFYSNVWRSSEFVNGINFDVLGGVAESLTFGIKPLAGTTHFQMGVTYGRTSGAPLPGTESNLKENSLETTGGSFTFMFQYPIARDIGEATLGNTKVDW